MTFEQWHSYRGIDCCLHDVLFRHDHALKFLRRFNTKLQLHK